MLPHELLDTYNFVRDFLEAGGDILWWIAVVTFLMWTLIIERYWYILRTYRAVAATITREWRARRDTSSWYAHQIRRAVLSRTSLELNRGIPTIKTLVAICPLLGLLGTVTGMVEVFDVMAFSGSGNPRAMASGVAHATIPTLAGMTAALSGLILSVQLDRRARVEAERLADHLSPGK